MTTKKMETDQLVMLPMPLPEAYREAKRKLLAKELKRYTLEQIAMQELYRIYFWRGMKNSPVKRLYRNYTLAYSLYELKNLLLASYKEILNIN